MNKKTSLKLFYETLRIRIVEETISKKYHQQEMRCPVHLSIGQEAVPVGISTNLLAEDKIVTAHRSHAHYLAKGGSLKRMIAELYGKETGCAGGKGGSMHLVDEKAGIQAAVPIVGSTIPIGVGISWAMKLNKKKNLVVIYFGDGATEEGVFLESMDFASLHSLPCLFVCEDNNFSVYSGLNKRQSAKRSVVKIAQAIGLDAISMDGNNVFDVYQKTNNIINNIRKKKRPYLIHFKTFRHLEHCGPNNDDFLKYRSKAYIKYWMNKCPIKLSKKFLKKKYNLNDNEFSKIEKKIIKEVNQAFVFAKKSNFPKLKKLKKDIYAR